MECSSFFRDLLSELVLELMLMNGTPLLDVSLDLSPSDPGRFVGVIRVPQRSAMLPRLLRSRVGMAVFNKWVSERISIFSRRACLKNVSGNQRKFI